MYGRKLRLGKVDTIPQYNTIPYTYTPISSNWDLLSSLAYHRQVVGPSREQLWEDRCLRHSCLEHSTPYQIQEDAPKLNIAAGEEHAHPLWCHSHLAYGRSACESQGTINIQWNRIHKWTQHDTLLLVHVIMKINTSACNSRVVLSFCTVQSSSDPSCYKLQLEPHTHKLHKHPDSHKNTCCPFEFIRKTL